MVATTMTTTEEQETERLTRESANGAAQPAHHPEHLHEEL
jgi:hypothetical protein